MSFVPAKDKFNLNFICNLFGVYSWLIRLLPKKHRRNYEETTNELLIK